jgi:hypothetical protein
MKTVTQFVIDKMKPEYQPVFEKFRRLVKDKFPFLKEEMRGGTEK